MAFTVQGLNLFLQEFKSYIDTSETTLVARARNTANFIAGGAATFGSITNNEMNLYDPVVLTINALNDVGSLSLFEGVVTDQTSMSNAVQLAQVFFAVGTYNFAQSGTLTISDFKISAEN